MLQLVHDKLSRNGKLKDSQGTCTLPLAVSPMSATYNITGQISHFNSLGFNTFRLPVSWQYLTDSTYTTTGVLNTANFAAYDAYVKLSSAFKASKGEIANGI
jgi:hypothetical protein